MPIDQEQHGRLSSAQARQGDPIHSVGKRTAERVGPSDRRQTATERIGRQGLRMDASRRHVAGSR